MSIFKAINFQDHNLEYRNVSSCFQQQPRLQNIFFSHLFRFPFHKHCAFGHTYRIYIYLRFREQP